MIERIHLLLNLKLVNNNSELILKSFFFKGFIQYIVEPSFIVMGDMLEKILKSLNVSESELPSPSIPAKSMTSSPSPSPSPGSSNESNPQNDERNG